MRFQAKLLLAGIVVAGAGALGQAAAHGTGHDHPAHGHADHDPSTHGHASHGHPAQSHTAPDHEHSSHNHAAQNHDHAAHGAAAQPDQPSFLEKAGITGPSEKYTCPMHPNIVTGEPGSCPICGMHLVKVAQAEPGKNNDQVHVDVQTQQRMGVQLQTAEVASMHRAINTFATISPDQSRSVSVSSFVEGWIKRWHVQGVGQPIKQGQVLYEIYSPDLQQRQREYINILTRRDTMASSTNMDMSAGKTDMSGPSFIMMRALAKDRFRTRDRLLAAGVPPHVLKMIEEHRRVQDVVPIHATQDGVITEISAREGSYVNPLQPVLAYTDNAKVWAEVTLFPDQIGWLQDGNEVTLTSGLDAKTQVHARVDLSALQVDPASRTARLRLPIPNADNAFYPGSYAKATIKADERHVLSVPRDAVIRTGHGQYVVVSDEHDHFRSAPVNIGIETAHAVEIRSGLEPGSRIVVNGQFLLDAASSLQSMQRRLAAASIHAATPDGAPIASARPASTHMHAHP